MPTFTITATALPHGSITPSGANVVTQGDSLAFAITPDDGFSVADVVVDGASVGPTLSYIFSNVQADHSIIASYYLDSTKNSVLTNKLSYEVGEGRNVPTIDLQIKDDEGNLVTLASCTLEYRESKDPVGSVLWSITANAGGATVTVPTSAGNGSSVTNAAAGRVTFRIDGTVLAWKAADGLAYEGRVLWTSASGDTGELDNILTFAVNPAF